MHDVLQLVEHLPELAGAIVESQLSSGPLSDKWLLRSAAGRWVLRRDKPLAARLNLGRNQEPDVLAELAAEGWCVDALWSDALKGILVVPFVPGRVWADRDLQRPAQLGRLANLLYRLHNSTADLPPFLLEDRVRSYAQFLDTPAAAQCAENICHLLAESADPIGSVVCHNDPVAGNVIDDGELHLIDFEFAAAGSPLFDLAAVIGHHRLPEGLVDAFTDAYREAGGSCDARLLEQWRMIYGQTVSLWNQIVAAE